MKFEHVFTARAAFESVLDIGQTPLGQRIIFNVVDGTVEGPKVNGSIIPCTGDWALVLDGWAQLDVRVTIRTEDGALIYWKYFGWSELTDKVWQALDGKADMDFGDHYARGAPLMESGDPRYAWVNHRIFVSESRLLSKPGIEIKVYEVL